MKKYCSECGEKLVLEWTGKYCVETGEKVYRRICPVDPCGHERHPGSMWGGKGMEKYCTECGAKRVPEWTGKYSAETGEKTYREVCPVDPCGHGQHLVEHIDIGLLDYILHRPNRVCARCGVKWFYPTHITYE